MCLNYLIRGRIVSLIFIWINMHHNMLNLRICFFQQIMNTIFISPNSIFMIVVILSSFLFHTPSDVLFDVLQILLPRLRHRRFHFRLQIRLLFCCHLVQLLLFLLNLPFFTTDIFVLLPLRFALPHRQRSGTPRQRSPLPHPSGCGQGQGGRRNHSTCHLPLCPSISCSPQYTHVSSTKYGAENEDFSLRASLRTASRSIQGSLSAATLAILQGFRGL